MQISLGEALKGERRGRRRTWDSSRRGRAKEDEHFEERSKLVQILQRRDNEIEGQHRM